MYIGFAPLLHYFYSPFASVYCVDKVPVVFR